jgi:uncharacterized membrane protein
MTVAPVEGGPLAAPSHRRTITLRRYPLALAAQALALFGLIGGSLGLFVATTSSLGGDNLARFLDQNSLEKEPRFAIFGALVLGGAIVAGAALLYLLIRGRTAVAGLRRAAEIALPLAWIGTFPSLFTAQPWHDQPLTFMIGLSLVVIGFERSLRRSLRAMPAPLMDTLARKLTFRPALERWLPLSVVLLGCLGYSVYFSYYTILNHHRLGTAAYDLGININWAYNAWHGYFSRCTIVNPEGGNYFGVHAVLAMLTWVPFCRLTPTGEALLVVQAAMAGFAGWTLYLFASTQIPRWSAVIISLAYLMYAPLHGPNFYDFHELMPPLMWHFLLYWAIAKEKNWLIALLVPLLWTYREDLTVGLTVLGVFLLVTGLRPKVGIAIAVPSLIYFVVVKMIIMPQLWSGWFDLIYRDLQAGQRGLGAVIQTILINPAYFLTTLLKEQKLVYLLHMFTPLALLPARRPALWLLAAPGFAFSLLTTGYQPTISIAFQYTCHAIPYIFAASVLMLRLLGRAEEGALRRRAALGAVTLGVLAHSYVFGAVLQHQVFVGGFGKVEFEMNGKERQRYQTMKRLAAMIPENAAVAATETEVPHVSWRADVYTLKDSPPPHADYVLVNANGMGLGNSRGAFQHLLDRHDYGLLAQGDDLYLFKRGYQSQDTTAALRTLGMYKKHKNK